VRAEGAALPRVNENHEGDDGHEEKT
jgi:hypothetical protein